MFFYEYYLFVHNRLIGVALNVWFTLTWGNTLLEFFVITHVSLEQMWQWPKISATNSSWHLFHFQTSYGHYYHLWCSDMSCIPAQDLQWFNLWPWGALQDMLIGGGCLCSALLIYFLWLSHHLKVVFYQSFTCKLGECYIKTEGTKGSTCLNCTIHLLVRVLFSQLYSKHGRPASFYCPLIQDKTAYCNLGCLRGSNFRERSLALSSF